MKRVDLYICEVCGTEYADKAQCKRCEKGHKEPKEITGIHHKPLTKDATGYPESIDVQMSDGKTVEYKKLRP